MKAHNEEAMLGNTSEMKERSGFLRARSLTIYDYTSDVEVVVYN